MMVGREVSSAYPKRDTVPGEEILRVENLCRKDRRQNVSFSLRKGEVLGIAGLVGAGRTEIMRGLFGVDYITSCDVYVHGQKVRILTPAAAKHGIAFFDRRPQDRGSDARLHHQGQHEHGQPAEAAPGSAHEREGGKRDRGPVYQADQRQDALAQPEGRQSLRRQPAEGRHRQVAERRPEILRMDEPTRGIDVGAKWEIYGIINELAAQGKAVILISSELPEVLGMSDRVLVVKDDAIVAELTGDEINAVEVMRYAL